MAIYKDEKRNSWYVKYNSHTKRGFPTKKEAQQYEAQLRLEITQPKLTKPEVSKSLSFSDMVNEYLEYKKTSVVYDSLLKIKNCIEVIGKLFDMGKNVYSITKIDCKKFYEQLSESDYSTYYKNAILVEFRALFKYAINFHDLHEDPSIFLKSYKFTYEEKLSIREKDMNIFTDDEFKAFISHVDKQSYRMLFIVLYFTGMRLGEALALNWKDFRANTLDIYKSCTSKTQKVGYEIKETKNVSSIRSVGISHAIEKELLAYRREEQLKEGFSEDWFIFGGEKPLPRTTIDRVKNRAIKSSGVKQIRTHDFRHSHASNLIGNGMNIVAVSRRLGHNDINTTLKVYAHVIKKTEQQINDYLESSAIGVLESS